MTARIPMIDVTNLQTLIGKAVSDEDGDVGMVVDIDPTFCGGDFPIVVNFNGWVSHYTADGYLWLGLGYDDHYIKLG
jgi:hypothetical protein